MKKAAVIITSILIALVSPLLLSSCLPMLVPEPTPPPEPAPVPEPTPPPEPAPVPEPVPPPDEPEEPAPIENITWALEAYGDRGSLQDLVEDTEITAEFKSADSTVVGSAGCNSYLVTYGIDGDSLTATSPIAATEMACLPPIMDQEQEYFQLLATTETFLIHNDKLIISCSDNKEMVFTEKDDEEMPPEEEIEIPKIEDISWQLEAYGDRGSLQPLIEDTKITAEFKSDEGTVAGSAGCNSYFVAYEIDDWELTVTPPIGATLILCFPPPIMDQEQEYLNLLETAESFLVHNEKLIISCSDNKELVFIEEIPSIEDITWQLEAYGDAGSPQALVAGTEITVVFKSADGTVGGSGGCNGYFAEYEIDNYDLTVSTLGATMMLCFPAPIMNQEQEYFDLIQDAETFRVQDDRLIISCADDKVLVFAE